MIPALLLAATIAVPPTPTHYVTDTAGVISTNTSDALEGELRSYEQTTGHQVIVWIGRTTGDQALEEWTSQTAQQWRVGHKGKDDGVILFLFMDDHKVRIEVGYGLESVLPDATASLIIRDDIVPAIRRGDVDGAVRTGAERIMLDITPSFRSNLANPPPSESMTKFNDPSGTGLIVFLIFLTVFLSVGFGFLSVYLGRRRKGHRHGGYWVNNWFASGGSGGGGGGFSGGGGSFGGGGASGGW